MRQTYLGHTGLVVSELCLGTMMFGGAADPEASRQIVERFREAGGTFFDTANRYTDGRSEEILGKIIGGDRDEVVIATKAAGPAGPGPNDRSASRRHLVKAVEDSLTRLGTDYIDLYQMHRWDSTTPLEETLSTLEDLVRSGKVLHLGVSNYFGWHIERTVRMQEAAGYDRFVSLQNKYSLIDRKVELEALPAARANGMAILPWSPLGAGFLTGKYRRGEDNDGAGRFAARLESVTEQGWATLEAVRGVAKTHDTEPAGVAIAWLLAQPDVIPVVGATRADQLKPCLDATELRLSSEALSRLSAVSAPELGYPYDFGEVAGRPERTHR